MARNSVVDSGDEYMDDPAEDVARMEHDNDFYADYDPWSDVEQGMYDDDPNPYHGDYSEM